MVSAEPARPFFSGIILAAGASTRMGRQKQLLLLHGRAVLQHVVDAAAAACLNEILLVLGDHADAIAAAIRLPYDPAARILTNREYREGQSTSLRLGLAAVSSQATAAAVLLGDQPLVTSGLIDRVAAAFMAADAPVARPMYRAGAARIPGHPVFLSRRIWPEVEMLRGDHGVRALLAAHPDWLLEVPIEGEPPADLDTWEDYQRLIVDPSGLRH